MAARPVPAHGSLLLHYSGLYTRLVRNTQQYNSTVYKYDCTTVQVTTVQLYNCTSVYSTVLKYTSTFVCVCVSLYFDMFSAF